jgi:hypothetical protein
MAGSCIRGLFRGIEEFYETVPVLNQLSGDSSSALIAAVGLGPKSDGVKSNQPIATMVWKPYGLTEQEISLIYDLRSSDGGTIENGAVHLSIESIIPGQFALHQNYPNPFNPVTTIRYEIPTATEAYLVVYNILGKEVIRLATGLLEPGYHRVVWNSRDRFGRELPSGIYIARLLVPPTAGVTPAYTRSIKLVLLK